MSAPVPAVDERRPSRHHGISKDRMQFGDDPTLRDGYMLAEHAERAYREFAMRCGVESADERQEFLVKLAIALSRGTSAETEFSERYVERDDEDTSLAYLLDVLANTTSVGRRTNVVRVWARSMPGFAELTRDVIASNAWLRRERALDYEVHVEIGDLCFDYADALKSVLTPEKNSMIKAMLAKKAKNGRGYQMRGEAAGVPGTDPVSRGVASSIMPDSSRLTGRAAGAGPYAG